MLNFKDKNYSVTFIKKEKKKSIEFGVSRAATGNENEPRTSKTVSGPGTFDNYIYLRKITSIKYNL